MVHSNKEKLLDDVRWIEIRPYQSFQDDFHLKDIMTKIDSTAFFFTRQNDTTKILVRTNSTDKKLFKELDQIEALDVVEPDYLDLPYVRRLRLKKHYAIPIATEIVRSQIYNILEQVKEKCVVACYIKRDSGGASSIWSWISYKESKAVDGKKISPQLRNFIDMAKHKAKELDFFQCEIILGAQNKTTFDLLQKSVPQGITRRKTISQKKFILKKFRYVKNAFSFAKFQIKKPLFSKTFPLLGITELLNIVCLPEDVTKMRITFGKYVAYSQGPQQSIKDTDVIIPE